jgi:hypothetical protein
VNKIMPVAAASTRVRLDHGLCMWLLSVTVVLGIAADQGLDIGRVLGSLLFPRIICLTG